MNQNQIQHPQIPQPKKIDINHYKLLLLDKKYWIIIIALVFSTIWLFIAPKLLVKQQLYNYRAVIRFDDPYIRARVGGVEDRITMMETESRIGVIKTTKFIMKTIDSLKLNIQSATPGLFRKDFFKKISNEQQLEYGKYTIVKKENSKVEIRLTNGQLELDRFLIKTIPINNDTILNIQIPGFDAEIFVDTFKDRNEIHFSHITDKHLIETIRNNINANLNRQQTLLLVEFKYHDPYLGAEIINMMVDNFFEQSLESKKFKTKNMLVSLEEQVKISKDELDKAENALKLFREANPHVYLTQNAGESARVLSTDKATLNIVQNDLLRLGGLIEDRDNASGPQEVALIYQEALRFLEERNLAGISAISLPYQVTMREKERLIENNYADTNQRMIEVTEELSNLQNLIDTRVRDFLSELRSRKNSLSNNIKASERRLHQAPGKEIQLTRYMRDREVKAQIYSNLLVRYNEVKIAHVSVVTDIELLQEAEVPIFEGGGLIQRLTKLIILLLGPILGIAFATGIFIGSDFIWHYARSVKDIESMTDLPVLASIPIIKNQHDIPDDFKGDKRIDPQLATIDYTPTLESESFRNLRTRLVLNKNKEETQKIIISSLMPNDGKSLVASNLAVTFAQLKKPTLLIDADTRRGVLHNSFLCDKKPGLSDLLARVTIIDSESIGKIIQKTTIPNLHLISSGTNIPNPTEILIGEKIEQLIKKLEQQFHHIIIDTPPIDFIPDALVLNKFINNIILVIRYGITDINRIKKKLKEYDSVRDDFKGIILNGAKNASYKKYSAYSYYKY